MTLAAKSIVITGAGRGVGRACAILAAELGASVIVNDIDADVAGQVCADIVANGGNALADDCDISTWSGAEAMVERCVSAFGGIDGLINNAALFRPCRLTEADEQIWRDTIETNVLGVAFATTHAARRMSARGSGAIVNMTSAAHQGATNLAPYGTSKGAVSSLTYCAALDLGPQGIRVNAVSPFAATRMVEAASQFGAASGHLSTAALPTPEENAAVACYLLSDAAHDFNGQIIRVERGGLSMLGHPVVLSPYPKGDTANYAAVRDAMADELRKQFQPVGIHYGHLQYD